MTADEVVGMPVEEGRALLEDLLARATRPGRVYRHEWSPGDLVVWDNTGVLHRARPYAPDSAREMHRTTMSGDEPVRDHESAHEVEPAHHRAPEHCENRSRP